MSVLEQKGVVEILLFLLEEERAADISDMRKKLSIGHSALYSALEKLKKAGLIEEKKRREFPFNRFFLLTSKGKKVAEYLAEIERVLRE